jgi:leucyl-tRNA synthetase
LTKKAIPGWFFKITEYAEELLSAIDNIDWPEHIKTMQRNWIGRSEGCEVNFATTDGQIIPVFTTRPDTLFGATFFVMAPEHSLVDTITTDEYRAEVQAYVEEAIGYSEIERSSEKRSKTGVFTGGYVINPINSEKVPV